MKLTGETEQRDRPPSPLVPRPRHGFGGWPVLVASAALGVAAIVVAGSGRVGVSSGCTESVAALTLAGSQVRFAAWLADCPVEIGDLRASAALIAIAWLACALTAVCITRRWWPLYHAPRLRRLERSVVAAPVVAAVTGVTSLGLGVAQLRHSAGSARLPASTVLPVVTSTFAWVAIVAAVASSLAVVMALFLAVARRHEPAELTVGEAGADATSGAVTDASAGDLGICCSGGGIRAAAFSLGALERLERAGVTDRARWLTAVSGGSYAATAWRVLKADDPARPAAPEIVSWLTEAIPGSSGGRHRFLRNGPGGLGRSVLAALLYISFNVVVLGALVFVLAWPVGWVLGSPAVQPALRGVGGLPESLPVPAALWWPGVVIAGLAAVVFVISALPSWRVAALWRVSAGLLALAALLELLLVGVPSAMVWLGRWLSGGTASMRATAVGGSAFAAALAAAWRIARQPVVSRVTSRLPELGGVLLVVVAFVWGGKVATDAATAAGALSSPWLWLGMTVGFGVVFLTVDTSELSIHRVYRKRLRRTFGLARHADGTVHSPRQVDQLRWEQMPADGPELVICCAQQRTGIAPGGLPAETFTISHREVRIGDHVEPTERYLSRLPASLATEHYVSSWIATSGAAFASAMGRLSKGSTNALMAAFNIDLGLWLPNPRLTSDARARFGRIRLGYLFKEILGWYDPGDRYVFVADGGHWENLGLVELLRRRCGTIVCLDASGDQVGAFTTLREAVELASLELDGVVARVDLTGLESIGAGSAAMPAGVVASLQVQYWNADRSATTPGTIHYAKAQMASGLDIALRRYAKTDPRFPNYSTGNQFLTNDQFGELVALGRAAGDRLADALADTGRSN